VLTVLSKSIGLFVGHLDVFTPFMYF